MVKKVAKEDVTTEKILEIVLDINERMATKDDLQQFRDEAEEKFDSLKEGLTLEIRAVSKAVDRDAETVIQHGKRIIVLERKVGVATK